MILLYLAMPLPFLYDLQRADGFASELTTRLDRSVKSAMVKGVAESLRMRLSPLSSIDAPRFNAVRQQMRSVRHLLPFFLDYIERARRQSSSDADADAALSSSSSSSSTSASSADARSRQKLAAQLGIADQQQLSAVLNMKAPHEWFPAARAMHRKIIVHAGPTNSGKTFHALNALGTFCVGDRTGGQTSGALIIVLACYINHSVLHIKQIQTFGYQHYFSDVCEKKSHCLSAYVFTPIFGLVWHLRLSQQMRRRACMAGLCVCWRGRFTIA